MDGRRGSPSRSGSAVAAKRARPRREVGILCHWMNVYYEIKLYLVDIDRQFSGEEEYALVDPAVRFRFPDRDSTFAVCLLQSNSNYTVYIFGGYDPHPRCPPHPKIKYAAKYVLSEKVIPDGNLEVKEEELDEIPHMNYIKGDPRAIPTPDGKKILVFESSTRAVKNYRGFELYDPEYNSWEVLPPLPTYCGHSYGPNYDYYGPRLAPEPGSETSDSEAEDLDCHYCDCFVVVTSYSFVDESHFFVETEEDGSYILDLETRKWIPLGIQLVPMRNESYLIMPFVTAKAQYALTPDGIVHSLGDGGFLSERPIVKSSEDVKLSAYAHHPHDGCLRVSLFPSILPLPPFVQGEVCTTCFLKPQLDYTKTEIRMLIDVCRTNLTTLDTEVSKRLKLRTNYLGHVYEFTMISV